MFHAGFARADITVFEPGMAAREPGVLRIGQVEIPI